MNLKECYRTFRGPEEQVMLNYLADLASTTGNDVRDWDIASIFKGEKQLLETDHRKINKIFFEQIKKQTNNTLTSFIPTQFVDAIEAFKQSTNSQLQIKKEQMVNNHLQQIKNYQDNIAKHQTEMKKIFDGKEDLLDIEIGINKVLSDPFYKLHKIEHGPEGPRDSRIYFETDNVILTENVNGEELKLPMGKYLIRYRPLVPDLLLHYYIENIFSRGYYHPYANTNGTLCWGNSQATASKFLAEGKMKEVFDLLKILLTTYVTDSNPHRALGSFITDGTMADSTPWKAYYEAKERGLSYEQEKVSPEEQKQEAHDNGECGDECRYCSEGEDDE